MKSVEERFVGHGNTWLGEGRRRGWKIECSTCDAFKILTGSHGSSLPPDVIVKKLAKLGWYVANKPEHDICPGCILRSKTPPPVAKLPTAKPEAGQAKVVDILTPAELILLTLQALGKAKQAALLKQHKRVIQCIDGALRGLQCVHEAIAKSGSPAALAQTTALPRPKAKPKPAPQPIEPDSEFSAWLAREEQERTIE